MPTHLKSIDHVPSLLAIQSGHPESSQMARSSIIQGKFIHLKYMTAWLHATSMIHHDLMGVHRILNEGRSIHFNTDFIWIGASVAPLHACGDFVACMDIFHEKRIQ